jgi:OmpA-OmpF porin, OOP family
VKRGGIANKDLLAIGLGPKKPMASNDTAEGRAKNRRVEVVIPTNEALQHRKRSSFVRFVDAWAS